MFFVGSGTTGTLGATMVDLTPVPELGPTADSQFGELLVTILSGTEVADRIAIHQLIVWVGRTSTEPAPEDTGVRTRQYGANEQGMLSVHRIKGLRVNPGELMKLLTKPILESDTDAVNDSLVSAKWTFRELRQG